MMRRVHRLMAVWSVAGVVLGGLVFGSVPAFAADHYEDVCASLGTPALCTVGEFTEPLGVAVDNSSGATNGDVYVVVYTPTPEVLQFTAGGERTGLAPVTGPAGRELQLPLFVAVDSATGDFYVDDYLGGVVDKFKPDGELEEGFGTGGQLTGLEVPTGVAVQQSTGDLFVVLRGNEEVKEYSSAGVFLGSFKVLPNPLDSVAVDSAGDVYVDQEGGEVKEYPAGKRTEPVTIVGTGANAVAVDQATGDVFISESGGQEIGEYEPGGTLIEAFGQGSLGAQGSFGIGLNETTHGLYASNRAEGLTAIFSLVPPSPPQVENEGATGVAQTTATLTGSVNPEHETPTACAFHYALNEPLLASSPSVAECTPAASELGSGNTPVAVSANLEGLAANTVYYYRLTASNPTGPAEGPIHEFLTLPDPPAVNTGEASELAPYTAVINATVNPNAAGHAAQDDTTYRFQYSTDETFTSQTALADAGEGTSPIPVHAQLEGLAPDTTYHYRVLATNNNTGTPQTTTGEPKTFTTVATPPVLTGAAATQVSSSSALITATLQPQGLPTRWELQLSTNPAALEYKAAGNSTSPEAEPIGAQLENLQPNTPYYYRLTAENPDGNTETPLQAFTTTANPAAPQTAQVPSYPILGVPPNIFPTEARVTSTIPKKIAKCPRGRKRDKGRCVRVKRKGSRRAKKGRTH
jgi:hypothetical protein